MYKYFQPNDKDLKDKYGDCAVRAVCVVENLSWLDAYDIMYKYSRKVQSPMNCKIGFEEIMQQLGYTYVGVSNKKGTKAFKDIGKEPKSRSRCCKSLCWSERG